ncbi:MAG: aspartate kinase, partial [Epulopiscium sp. Nele67-Bin001]
GGQAGIITNDDFTQADLIHAEPKQLLDCVAEGFIPVVAGFQGATEDGQVTTIGRGGSDTTASMLGSSVGAKRIEIFTDVDGVMTGDPRVCDRVHIIPAISYNEVFQMADSGAKVIHPRAVEYAMRANIPLVIKNTFTEAEGTFIVQTVPQITTDQYLQEHHHKIVSSVAHRVNRVQYTIEDSIFNEIDLLDKVARASVSIDLINIFPTMKVFTIDGAKQEKLETLLHKYNYKYTKVTNCAKVTLIGERMTGIPGVIARAIKTLTKLNVNILQTADSLTTIAVLIPEGDLSKVICALHEEFNI